MQIYYNKNVFKLVIVGLALIIGLASIIYTNYLVNQLAEREVKQIEFYARAQKLINTNTGEAFQFLFDII